MRTLQYFYAIFFAIWVMTSQAQAGQIDPNLPRISYVQFPSFDIVAPGQELTVGGQLRIPVNGAEPMPAVVILHGSAGVDSRGSLYARALNDAGIATLEIDMWGARGITGADQRPPLPTFTLPDAYGALNFLANAAGIDPQRVGVLGFSWGGVMSLLSANKSYTSLLGNGQQFAAHVAHYPICWGYTAGIPGIFFGPNEDDLTDAPVLIQIGSKDDYDEGAAPCEGLAAPFPNVSVTVYPNAYHGWDRLQPRLTVQDPFSHLGEGVSAGCDNANCEVNIVPNPGKANQSGRAVVSAFSDAFGMTGN
jgi:dienelactone hydrolase